jgi:hypothetical protein
MTLSEDIKPQVKIDMKIKLFIWYGNIYIYCHVLVNRHGVWIDNWIYWALITRNYEYI